MPFIGKALAPITDKVLHVQASSCFASGVLLGTKCYRSETPMFKKLHFVFNYLENLGLSVLEQGRIIHSKHQFCLPGVRMLVHAVSTSGTATFITHLPFLLVETSTGQSFCIVIKLYFEAFFLYWIFFFGEKISIF